MRKYIVNVVAWIAIFMAAACSQDDISSSSKDSDEQVDIYLSIDQSNYQRIDTRSSRIDDTYVLVFDPSNQKLIQARKPSMVDSQGNFKVSLNSSHGKEVLLVVAHRTQVDDENSLIAGLTYAEAKEKFTFQYKNLKKGAEPLWGELTTVIESSNKALKVPMIYAVAKVSLDVEASVKEKFTPEEFTLGYHNEQGYTAFGNPVDSSVDLCDAEFNPHEFVSLIDGFEQWVKTSTYVPEGGLKQQKPTRMVVKGKYNGIESFYAIDLIDAHKKPIRLKRGYNHKIVIDQLVGPGFTTVDKAQKAVISSNTVTYHVEEWKSGITDMWMDGNTFFGLSTEAVVLSPGNQIDIPIQMSENIKGSPINIRWKHQSSNPFEYKLDRDKQLIRVSLSDIDNTDLKSNVLLIDLELDKDLTDLDTFNKTHFEIPVSQQGFQFKLLSIDADLYGRYIRSVDLVGPTHVNGGIPNQLHLLFSYLNLESPQEIYLKSDVQSGIYFEGMGTLDPQGDQTTLVLDCKSIGANGGPTHAGEYTFIIDLGNSFQDKSMTEVKVKLRVLEDVNMLQKTKVLCVDNTFQENATESGLYQLLYDKQLFGKSGIYSQLEELEVTHELGANIRLFDRYHIIFYRGGTPVLQAPHVDDKVLKAIHEFVNKGGFLIQCFDGFPEEPELKGTGTNRTYTILDNEIKVSKHLSQCRSDDKKPYSYFNWREYNKIQFKDLQVPTEAHKLLNPENNTGEIKLNFDGEFYLPAAAGYDEYFQFNYQTNTYYGTQIEGTKNRSLIMSYFYQPLSYSKSKFAPLVQGSRLGVKNEKLIGKDEIIADELSNIPLGLLSKDQGYAWIGSPHIFNDGNIAYDPIASYTSLSSNGHFTALLMRYAINWVNQKYENFNSLNKEVNRTDTGYEFIF